ncbi:MAG: EAL domain-containing protein [Burkholderiaceae bacterium]
MLSLRGADTSWQHTTAVAGKLFLFGIVSSLLLAVAALIGSLASGSKSGISYPSAKVLLLDHSAAIADPHAALEAFRREGTRSGYSANKQPYEPYWLGLTLPADPQLRFKKVVELRMLRSSNAQFWAFDPDATKRPKAIPLQAANEKGGLAIRLEWDSTKSVELIGRVEPIGVARPKLFVWDDSAFSESVLLFERGGGGLLGSFLMLAVFSAFVGFINKDWSFFLFSGWLITSLRVASINDGWDLIWLGINLDSDNLLILLRVTLAAHALLTIALYRSLLSAELANSRLSKWLSTATGGFAAIVILSPFLPHRLFLPLLWVSSALGISLILFSLGMIVYRTRSSVSMWYAASWGLTFSGILTEVAFASGILAGTFGGLNSQTASIASALVTAIALAEKLRIERIARVTAQREKFEVLEKFKENYDSMPVGLFSVSTTGHVTLFNPAFASMFGLSPVFRQGESLLMETLIGTQAHSKLTSAALTHRSAEIEFCVSSNNDQPERWFLARVTSKGTSIEGSIQDITTRKEAETKLRHLVDHDPLTGMLNRRGLEEALTAATQAASRLVPCAIAHVDLDRFKLVNDLYGHAIGDAMLIEAASRLTNTIRSRDHVARIADSFVVVFLDCPDHAVNRLTERLRESIGDFPFEIHGKALNMTVSVGVVPLEPSMGAVDAMTAADRACAEAKARGRNCVVRLNEKDAMLKSHLEELKVVAGLRQRIPIERYFLEFQPIVSLRSARSSLSYEVLIRMRDEAGGVVPPGRFIGAAERNGLMSQIDRWVLRSTLQWLDDHPDHRDRLTFATINLSGASLNDARFVDDAFSMMAEHPLAVTKLCFEITESVALNDLGATRRFVDRVRVYGSKLALDDFGAGYTSFNYLKEIPADFIKIDGSFVRDINRNPANYAITRTIVDLTHELGMRSIAEWAETADTIASLLELRVDFAQGFCLARPLAQELLADAPSGGALVRDPNVIALLDAGDRQLLSLHPAGNRRH